MQELNLNASLNKEIQGFIQALKLIYAEKLISVSLYGSASSGEFVPKHSNLNLFVVLNCAKLQELKKVSAIAKKFRNLNPLFMDECYINTSIDTFPLEFLDMKENHLNLYGKDLLKDIIVDVKNLRFQCEQELKSKLIGLRQFYIKFYDKPQALNQFLLKSFTSVLHILRNTLRIKLKISAYARIELIKELSVEFGLNRVLWEKILAVKMKQAKFKNRGIEQVFLNFEEELTRVTNIVDAW